MRCEESTFRCSSPQQRVENSAPPPISQTGHPLDRDPAPPGVIGRRSVRLPRGARARRIRRGCRLRRAGRGRGPPALPLSVKPADVDYPELSLPGLPHDHPGPRRYTAPCRPVELKALLAELHHEVVPDRPNMLQAEHVLVPYLRIPREVVVDRTGRRHRIPRVVGREIDRLGIRVRRRIIGDAPHAHLLDQAILLGPVTPLHPTLRLRTRRRDDLDAQLRAHPAELRVADFARRFLRRGGLPLVHVLPIRVQRPGHPVRPDPRSQNVHGRPDRLLLTETQQRRAGRVVDHVHHTAPAACTLASPFEPVVEAPVELHQLSEMGPPLPALRLRPRTPLPAPQPRLTHPVLERRARYPNPVILPQMLRNQGGPKPLARPPLRSARVLPLDALPHPIALGPLPRTIRTPPHASVHQPRRPFPPVPPVEPSRLPIRNPEEHRRFLDRQPLTLHPPEYRSPLKLLPTHRCPLHSALRW